MKMDTVVHACVSATREAKVEEPVILAQDFENSLGNIVRLHLKQRSWVWWLIRVILGLGEAEVGGLTPIVQG